MICFFNIKACDGVKVETLNTMVSLILTMEDSNVAAFLDRSLVGYKYNVPVQKEACPWPNLTNAVYFSCRFATCHLKYFCASGTSLPVTMSGRRHLRLIMEGLLLHTSMFPRFGTPSGVFTITRIIYSPGPPSPVLEGFEQGTTSLHAVLRGGAVIIAKSNHMRWNLLSNHNERGEHLL